MNQNIWSVIDLNACPHEVWRNSGGTTQTLLAWPKAPDWQVRCSVASVAHSGAFSSFVGVQRWFAVLHGAGVVLQIDNTAHALTLGSEPLQFDGAAHTDCTLIAGKTLDFNLMVHGLEGHMQRVKHQHTHLAAAGQWVACYSHTHSCTLKIATHTLVVPAQNLAWLHCTCDTLITLDAHEALWMHASA